MFYKFLIIGLCVYLSACSFKQKSVEEKNNPQQNKISNVSTDNVVKPNHNSVKISAVATTEDKSKQTDPVDELELVDPPLFSYLKPTIEPLMWTNEPADEARFLVNGTPSIVGRLPGQRELPFEMFDEAAIPHRLDQLGTVVYSAQKKEPNLWNRVKKGYSLPHQSHKRIDDNIRWFARHPAYLKRVAKRAEKYLYYIVSETERLQIPLEIALLPVVESAFQPFAYSHGRAAGIWQFIPSTGKLYGLKQNWWYDGRRDIGASTKAALRFLKDMHDSLNDDWFLALAAYNSGYGTVSRAIRKNKRKGKATDFWSLKLPRETRNYVPKLLAIAEIINNPKKYDINLPVIKNKPYLVEVDTESQIDLALAAQLAEISVEQLYILNPGYNRWATDPNGPHKLMLPIEKAGLFSANLKEVPPEKRLAWKRHKIRRGQTLLAIADKYNTPVSLIKELNQIRGNLIREGQNLIIPVSSKKGGKYTLSAKQRMLALQNNKPKNKAKVTYRVKSGDSWWSISRKYKVNYRSLAKWNGASPKDTLRLGQKLVVWTKNAPLKRAAFSPHSSNMVTQKVRYRVVRGDSLARISRKFNVSLRDLMRWNNLKKRSILRPGQRLIVYVDVTQQAG